MADLSQITDGHVSEIRQKVDMWEDGVREFLDSYDEYSDFFRMRPPGKRLGQQGMTNTRVSETVRATEALSSSIFRMLTVNDPNFELMPLSGQFNNSQAMGVQSLLQWQNIKLRYKRMLMKGLRSLCLFGTGVADEPWISRPGAEGTGFMPRSLLQFAFDPSAP